MSKFATFFVSEGEDEGRGERGGGGSKDMKEKEGAEVRDENIRPPCKEAITADQLNSISGKNHIITTVGLHCNIDRIFLPDQVPYYV